MYRDTTLWKLERLSDRLAELLKEDPHRQQTMRNLSKLLLEEAATIIADMDEDRWADVVRAVDRNLTAILDRARSAGSA